MRITKSNVKGLPKDTHAGKMTLDQQRQLIAFKETAKSTHLSQKRRSYKTAIREFIGLYEATEYYCTFMDGPDAKDDTFQVWYK